DSTVKKRTATKRKRGPKSETNPQRRKHSRNQKWCFCVYFDQNDEKNYSEVFERSQSTPRLDYAQVLGTLKAVEIIETMGSSFCYHTACRDLPRHTSERKASKEQKAAIDLAYLDLSINQKITCCEREHGNSENNEALEDSLEIQDVVREDNEASREILEAPKDNKLDGLQQDSTGVIEVQEEVKEVIVVESLPSSLAATPETEARSSWSSTIHSFWDTLTSPFRY
ncbi:hypothetical protein EDC96DRAFT_533198, partial [Choanephora cucurbitarum]